VLPTRRVRVLSLAKSTRKTRLSPLSLTHTWWRRVDGKRVDGKRVIRVRLKARRPLFPVQVSRVVARIGWSGVRGVAGPGSRVRGVVLVRQLMRRHWWAI
jgi:hypothetical protein